MSEQQKYELKEKKNVNYSFAAQIKKPDKHCNKHIHIHISIEKNRIQH